MSKITFDKQGHDSFLDFIKAWAIICVLIGHTFPSLNKIGYSLWLGNQVPLFILIQTFHSYKQGAPKIRFNRVLDRVLLPFLLCEVIVFFVSLLKGGDANNLISSALLYGGYGPGSFYPWVYFQMAILLPLIYPFITRIPQKWLILLFIFICESLEVICSLVNLPDWIYRLLAVRYLFLVYLSLEWIRNGIVFNLKMLIFSLLSLAAIVYFRYYSINDEPLFFNTAWKTARWPCYYYVANLYVWILHWIWRGLSVMPNALKWVKVIASSTYEIYLVQMSVIFLFNVNYLGRFIEGSRCRLVVWAIVVWCISIGVGVLINTVKLKIKSIKQ